MRSQEILVTIDIAPVATLKMMKSQLECELHNLILKKGSVYNMDAISMHWTLLKRIDKRLRH